jgi:adenylosuccinate synthase
VSGLSPVLLSGSMYAGKTTLALLLNDRCGHAILSARDVLRRHAGSALETRDDLQWFGAELERLTGGSWLGEAAAALAADAAPRPIVIDAARTRQQVSAIKQAVSPILHVHVSASSVSKEKRFLSQADELIESSSFERASGHPIEREASLLDETADLVVDTSNRTPDEVFCLVEHALRHLRAEATD